MRIFELQLAELELQLLWLLRQLLDTGLRVLVVRDADRLALRFAVRWLGRFALEARGVTIDTLRAAADALNQLPRDAPAAMERLQRICFEHRLA